MDSASMIIENVRNVVGFTGMRDFIDLGKIRQSRLEQKLSAASKNLSIKNMASIYMAWLFQQISCLDRHSLSQVVEQWVAYVDTWGLECTEAITMWSLAQTSKSNRVEGAMSWKSERLKREMKSLRRELELQFLKVRDGGRRSSEADDFGCYNDPECLTQPELHAPMFTWPNPKDMVYNSKHGKARKWDEYQEDNDESSGPTWTLENWPTRDIPFPSIESAGDEECEEWDVLSDIESEGTMEETAEEPSPKRQKLDVEDSIKAALELLENPPQTPDLRTPTPFRLYEPLTPASIDSSPPSLVFNGSSVHKSSHVDSLWPDEAIVTSSFFGYNAEVERCQTSLSSAPSLFDDLAWYC
ncbi:hypothetical protein NW762_001666 [Fusarium torreyae]|uniref:Uncharacterized protein n=1 Tax=Fusarium torreyae TaxID=1237075 RepID=A0A9W8SEW7_9HYPO|nr:hypothetical protein NW762_001666 [Fusarium torreyae]